MEIKFGNRTVDFYGQASVIHRDRCDILVSYSTPVVLWNRNSRQMYRLWNGMTNTTAQHIRKIAGILTAEYRALPFLKFEL